MKGFISSLTLALVLHATLACAVSKKILFVGDSITMGQYLNAYYGTQCVYSGSTCPENFIPFSKLFETKLPVLYPPISWTVVNRGANGTNTTDWLNGTRGVASAYTTNVIGFGADVTVLMLGTNDAVPTGPYDTNSPPQHVDLATYTSNLQQIIGYHKAAGMPLILMTPPPVNDTSGDLSFTSGRVNSITVDYVNAVKSLGSSNNVPVVDIWGTLYGSRGISSYASFFYGEDGIHLSQPGHTLIYDSLLPSLETVIGLTSAKSTATIRASFR